jgi:hypothetical protein
MKEQELELHVVPNGEGGLVRVWQPKGSRFRPEKVVSAMRDFLITEIVHLDDPAPDFGGWSLPSGPAPVKLPAAGSFVTVEVLAEPPPVELPLQQRSHMTIEPRGAK